MVWLPGLALLSHWRRHPGQFLALLAGLALATALWTGVQAINSEARSAYDQAAATLGQDQLSRLVRADGQPVPLETYVALRRAGYAVSPVISGVLRDEGARLRLLGFDPLTAPAAAAAPDLDDGSDIDLAGFFTGEGLLLAAQETARGPLPPGLPPIAESAGVPVGAAMTDIATAARLLGQTDPSYLLIAPEQPVGLPPLAEATDLQILAPTTATDIGALTDSFHLNLTAFGLLAFAVGLFIVQGAIGLAFEQRRGLVRTLRALGVPLRSVLIAQGVELVFLALLAGGLGLILGYVLASALMPGVAGTLRGLYGADVPGTLRFDPVWAVAGLAMALAGAVVAGAQAMVRTARMPLLAPAQPRAWARATARDRRWQLAGSGVCFAIGLAVFAIGDSLLAGFALLAAVLLGAALALPSVLAAGLGVLQRWARGPIAEWLLADTRQQLPGLSLALMALLLALAANIGVSTMVGSFRATFLGWLDQRLAAEVYLTTRSPEEAAAVQAYLDGRAEAVLPNVMVDARLRGAPGDVLAMADHSTYRDNWPLLSAAPNAWAELFAGNGVLINEQLARRHDIALGDTVSPVAGTALPVLGIYSDYGNPNGQAVVGIDLFVALFPDVPITRFALRTDDAGALVADLREDFGLPTEAVVNQAQIKAFSLRVFEQTFRITGALNVLTLAVAGFALFTALITLSGLRQPQLAPVWAIGLPRQRLALFEILRTLLLAALTFVLAVPLGLLLAWVLLTIVNVEAFGWLLPMRVFPLDGLQLLGLALLAAALAALLPARRLARMSPSDLLRVFSYDR